MKRALLALALISTPTAATSTTAPDLSGRIVLDGATTEYATDEWVLDAGSPRAELPHDSRWGSDNDVHRIAITWDTTFVYIAVECVTYSSGLMTWIEYAAGGIRALDGLGELRRQISFSSFAPNYLVSAMWGDVTVARVSASRAHDTPSTSRSFSKKKPKRSM